jgi:hypothetical protein
LLQVFHLIQVIGDVAYEVGVEHGQATFAGYQVALDYRVTNLYHCEAGCWKIVLRHPDISPAMLDGLNQTEARRFLGRPQSILGRRHEDTVTFSLTRWIFTVTGNSNWIDECVSLRSLLQTPLMNACPENAAPDGLALWKGAALNQC